MEADHVDPPELPAHPVRLTHQHRRRHVQDPQLGRPPHPIAFSGTHGGLFAQRGAKFGLGGLEQVRDAERAVRQRPADPPCRFGVADDYGVRRIRSGRRLQDQARPLSIRFQ